MTSLTDDLRSAFNAQGSALRRLILYNVVVFVVLIVVRAILHLADEEQVYVSLRNWLTLPAYPVTLLTRPWTLLTYAFVHEEFFHILFNMLNLYYFGQLIREYLGERRLVSLYVLGALAGGLAFVLAVNLIPRLQVSLLFETLRGASGAVTAIIVAAATLLPDYTFMLILLGPVRIKWIAAVLVLLSIAGLTGGNAGGEFAHLGGAVLGFTFIRLLKNGNDIGRPVVAVGNWLAGLFGGQPTMRVTHRQPTVSAPAGRPRPGGSPAPDEVDRILDKISRSGYDSLTKEEKQQLFRASQK